jgi:hypothetical protein
MARLSMYVFDLDERDCNLIGMVLSYTSAIIIITFGVLLPTVLTINLEVPILTYCAFAILLLYYRPFIITVKLLNTKT